MSFLKCFDVAKIAIDEATEKLSGKLTLNTEYLEAFEEYCNFIDELEDEFGTTSISAEVEDDTNCIILEIDCAEVTGSRTNNRVFQLIERSVRFEIYHNGSNVLFKLVFPSLWV